MNQQSQIILQSQTFRFNDILDQFPPDGKLKRKIFFQAELAALDNGSASFHIIAYPSWREKGQWIVGPKVTASESGNGSVLPFKEALGFANNELPVSGYKLKKCNISKKEKKVLNEFMRFFKKIAADPKLAARAIFRCQTRISKTRILNTRSRSRQMELQ